MSEPYDLVVCGGGVTGAGIARDAAHRGLGQAAEGPVRQAGPAAGARMSEPYDLVVCGGGVTGAGIARDAAHRGLKVALLEKGDFGSGTSSKSSKLVHGGLRYLERG